ncbi:uncharacterized protein znf518b [Nerophis lumbriciformis]|uniref:uncharacterized protein znf518b n=1 Tax=Nerophis lumbriciformis TaxID=546530 RepID=UPI002ADF0715|nr:uncharacterized protein LOC133617055 [Nerophis lumbriciformis]
MKPVAYQNFLSSMYGMAPPVYVVPVPSSPKMARCDKCGFMASDMELFKKHVLEHTAAKLYCSYCQKSVSSQDELTAHMQQHLKQTFTCPYCGIGYVRKLCMVKHIERVHNVSSSQGPPKIGTAMNPPSTFQPVGVAVPFPTRPAIRLDQGGPNSRTVDTKLLSHPNGISNNLPNHNRALTVSLPEEVSIPAGCLVELVEVKTVNGSKELKLRLVSQQDDNEVVMTDTRTAVEQNPPAGKTVASKLNATKITNTGMCFVNKKPFETMTPVSTSKSIVSNQVSMKRTSEEVINLSEYYPNKVSKTVHYPAKEKTASPTAWNKPVSAGAKSDGVIFVRKTCLVPPEKTELRVSQQKTDERMTSLPEHRKTISAVAGRPVRDMLTSVKVKASSKVRKTPDCINLENQSSSSSNDPSGAAVRVAPLRIKLGKNRPSPKSSFQVPSTLLRLLNESSSVKAPMDSSRRKSGVPAGSQGVGAREKTPEPESFPVISSVFSLSQQPGETQGAMVMALRGIVMDKHHNIEGLKPAADTQDRLPVKRAHVPVKLERHEKIMEHQPVMARNDIKKEANHEKDSMTQMDKNKCLKSENDELVCNKSSAVVYNLSKYVTVALTRVDEYGAWKKSRKRPKTRAPKYKRLTSAPSVRTDNQLMPLQSDQLMTQLKPVVSECKTRTSAPSVRTEIQLMALKSDQLATPVVSECKPPTSACSVRTNNQPMALKWNQLTTRPKPVVSEYQLPTSVPSVRTENQLRVLKWDQLAARLKPVASECQPPTSAPSVRTENQLRVLKWDQLAARLKPIASECQPPTSAPSVRTENQLRVLKWDQLAARLKPLASECKPPMSTPNPRTKNQLLVFKWDQLAAQLKPVVSECQPSTSAPSVHTEIQLMALQSDQLSTRAKPVASVCQTPTSAPSPRTKNQLMPLKSDQLVTNPGPDQPVVILNHPKPRSPVQETDAVTHARRPEKPAKCQILKMRLGKVMGRKYEVTGCTVRVSQ